MELGRKLEPFRRALFVQAYARGLAFAPRRARPEGSLNGDHLRQPAEGGARAPIGNRQRVWEYSAQVLSNKAVGKF